MATTLCEQAMLKKRTSGGGVVGGGTFQWVDSVLVKALQRGDWLLIDNANLSRSVLCL